ncbi:MAG: glycosyltransferase family protein [Candidatus Marinimicrobia bacterium]|nr:glycosyltransferase family protein [Candidatus Neomarinimicrobiota bacterium]
MNILYGIQTTGNGHIGRSRDIVKELKKRGHNVYVVFSGDQQKDIPDTEYFEPYKIFKGLTYVTENGKINYIKTAPKLDAISFMRDIYYYDAKNIDLIISDFEPVSVQISKKNRIPSVVLSHQSSFLYDIPYPPLHVMVRTIIEYFVPADFTVSTHWHHFGFPILPPILPESNNVLKRVKEEKEIIVYLPYEDPRKVVELLKKCPDDHKYHFFTQTGHLQEKSNITLHPKSRKDFLDTLTKAKGAILHAGFMANSESFDLGVKTLAKPIAGQAEQIANAMAIETLGFGMQMNDLDPREVEEWLALPAMRPMNYPRVAPRFVDWIEQGVFNNKSLTDMCEELWADIPIPQIFRK